jgi:predicted phosphate transport protein (TIGR00153 family)
VRLTSENNEMLMMSGKSHTDVFLGFRAEEKALRSAQEHASTVFSILEKLQEAIDSALKGDVPTQNQICKEITKLEMKADKLRRSMLLDLAKSTLEAADRETLVRLAKALDRVADWANDSSRLLKLVPLTDLNTEFKQLIANFARYLAKCGLGLKGAIAEMVKDFDKATKMANMVEEAEEEADELYLQGLSYLPECGMTHSAAMVVLIRDLLHNLENTADAAEDAVDQLRIIMLQHF